ncbi:MAG: hypothetical protein AMXMBFR46_07750 [Acidimicrobiia bacterium]
MNPNIYLHEVIHTVPGREEPYMASVRSLHDDPVRHDRLVDSGAAAQFRSVQTSGPWPQVINLWEKTWAGQTEDLVGQFLDTRRDTAMEEWWNRNLHLRRGGYDRLLIPTASSPTLDELEARGVACAVFLHEILWLPFGEPRRFLDRVEDQLIPALDGLGLVLVGAYRVAMRPRQVLTIIGAPEWSRLGELLARAATDPALAAWNEYRATTVQRAEEMVLLPARHGPLVKRP